LLSILLLLLAATAILSGSTALLSAAVFQLAIVSTILLIYRPRPGAAGYSVRTIRLLMVATAFGAASLGLIMALTLPR
jgi:hypothetical protein